jgi:hypothetical protein
MNNVNKKMENIRWKNMKMVEKNKKKESGEREVEQKLEKCKGMVKKERKLLLCTVSILRLFKKYFRAHVLPDANVLRELHSLYM